MLVRVSKSDFIKRLAQDLGVKRNKATEVYSDFFSILESFLTEKNVDRVKFGDFGAFVLVKRAKRTGVNPRTGEKIEIPSKLVLKFKPSKMAKEEIASS